MGDLFDEFMRELQRKRAEAERGGRPDGDPPGGDGGKDRGDADERGSSDDGGPRRPDRPRARDDEPATDKEEPVRLDARRRERRREDEAPRRPRATGAGGGRAGGGDGGRRGGPDDGRPTGFGGGLRRFGLGLVVVLVLVLITLAGVGLDLWTDAIWYRSVGFDQVFWTRIGAEVALFAIGLVVALVVLLANLWLAGRLAPPAAGERSGFRSLAERLAEAARRAEAGASYDPRREDPPAFAFDSDLPDLTPLARWIIAAAIVLVAIAFGAAAAGAWETTALWANRVPYSVGGTVAVDPIFERDISFYLFDLPFVRLLQSLASGLVVAALFVAGARYAVGAMAGADVLATPVRVHLGVLGGLYLATVAVGYQLDRFELVYSTSGAAPGVGYADQNARFFAYDALTVVSALTGALLIGGAFTRWIRPLGLALGVWFIASIALGRLYPEAIQRVVVDPNEVAQEERYIANNIAMTRQAYGLDGWDDDQLFRGEAPITEEAIAGEEATFRNARLWDYRPLQSTLDQLQTVRNYYDFADVDTDRYVIDGEIRQVMLSARELKLENSQTPLTWTNLRIVYTHGMGLALVPVNEVTAEGQPRLFVRDLPPTAVEGMPPITEPRIYFGELTDQYVVVGAKQREFDYPRGSEEGGVDEVNSWTGTTGIRLDSTLSRLLFALRFRDFDLLISDQLTNQSQLLFHRTLQERVRLVAPFLRYDKDPYLVIDGRGRLVYIQDAYTWSDRFPHATPFDPAALGETTALGRADFNYLRNSVKIVMDAYDGTLTFYAAQPDEPVLQAWSGVFPTLFRPMSDLPADLAAHLRYPEELFNVQTRVFGQYHLTPNQAQTLYSGTDVWEIPSGQSTEQSLPTEAYYVIMRMPGEAESEFLLLQPMVARGRPNMIAWVAARNDPEVYGGVRVYRFPSNTTVFGPAQIEARIDQDPIISEQFSLWSRAGSTVIRGNLLVVPVRDSLLYLQPVYLQSTSARFPEFERIIVASPTTVVWGETLAEALDLLLEEQGGGPAPTPTPGPGPTPSPGPSPTPGPTLPPDAELPDDVAGLVAYANQHFELAEAALRAGDFATYGDEIALVEAALQRLGELSPTPAP